MALTPDALKKLQVGIQDQLIVGYRQCVGKTILLPRQLAEDKVPVLEELVAEVSELVDGGASLDDTTYRGFSFLGSTLRAGPRIRRSGSSGDSGTLGLPLKDDNNGKYFLAAGHILSDYWRVLSGPVDRFVAGNQAASLGQIRSISQVKPSTPSKSPKNQLDVGIIEADDDVDAVDVTTCGFSIGPEGTVDPEDIVKKCGYFTGRQSAKVISPMEGIGVDHLKKSYFFEKVILLTDLLDSTFASQGDSGAVVVKEDGGFVGMLFAADIGAKKYLVAPASALRTYWESLGLGLTRL